MIYKFVKLNFKMIKKKSFFRRFSNILFFLVIVGMPIYILLSPSYWVAFSRSPQFYFLSFITCLLPAILIAIKPVLRNPFFLIPFTCSFIIASLSHYYVFFLLNYLICIGLVACLFGLFRTRPPFILLEIELYLTSYFMDFFEVHRFWRLIILAICPLFFPLVWFISSNFSW